VAGDVLRLPVSSLRKILKFGRHTNTNFTVTYDQYDDAHSDAVSTELVHSYRYVLSANSDSTKLVPSYSYVPGTGTHT